VKQIAVRRDRMAQAIRARRDGNNIRPRPFSVRVRYLMRHQRLHMASEGVVGHCPPKAVIE
jgi:hypothetical protein